MLPSQYRLPGTVSFKNAPVHATRYFVVKYVPNGLDYSRFGFIIGKAVAKEATSRNRARRILRSCVEERLEQILKGYDMLFLLKKGIIGAEREILLKETDKFLIIKKLLTTEHSPRQ